MSDRQTQLEELVAHQQRLLDELNAIVTDLRGEIDRLTLEQMRLNTTVARLVEYHEGAETSPDEKPPHY